MRKEKVVAFRKKTKGSVLAYAMIIIAAMVVIAATLSMATVMETKSAGATKFSAQSYQIADSGVQLGVQKINDSIPLNYKLSDAYPGCSGGDVVNLSTAGGLYNLSFYLDVSANNKASCNTYVNRIFSIKSVGTYQNTVRAVKVAVVNHGWVLGSCNADATGTALKVYREDVIGTFKWNNDLTACGPPQCSSPGENDGDNLVANNSVDFPTYPARQACRDIGGRLPTMNELACINASKAIYGNNFQPASYWSSTEGPPSYLAHGSLGIADKGDYLYVRCVGD